MAVDLNKIAEKSKRLRNIGVTKDAKLTTNDPRNDGSKENSDATTLETKRFFT